MTAGTDWRGGSWIAAVTAAMAALPGLFLPFLSDDWRLMEAVAVAWPAPVTPFGDFRPLLMAHLWLDGHLWGFSPAVFHLGNLLLLALTAFLAVRLACAYGVPGEVAAGAGVLFALHPYHVEPAAFIAARSDPLFAVFFLLAALAFGRWRQQPQGIPLLALVWFAASLLSKETALVLPLFLLLMEFLARPPAAATTGGEPGASPPLSRAQWWRGYGSLLVVVVAHLSLRTWALGGAGRTLLSADLLRWPWRAGGYATGALLPLDLQLLAARPLLWFLAAVLVVVLLVALTLRSGDLPRAAFGAGTAFAVLLSVNLVGFQERYLLLPTFASTLALVFLFRRIGGRLATVLVVLLSGFWGWGLAQQWSSWLEAGRASEALLRELTRVSRTAAVDEVLVVNMPFKVRGGSVAGDFRAALAVLGERPIPVREAIHVSYPDARADALAGGPDAAIRRDGDTAGVRLRSPRGPFSGLVDPRPPGSGDRLEKDGAILHFAGPEEVVIEITADPVGRRADYVWQSGVLQPLWPEGRR